MTNADPAPIVNVIYSHVILYVDTNTLAQRSLGHFPTGDWKHRFGIGSFSTDSLCHGVTGSANRLLARAAWEGLLMSAPLICVRKNVLNYFELSLWLWHLSCIYFHLAFPPLFWATWQSTDSKSGWICTYILWILSLLLDAQYCTF